MTISSIRPDNQSITPAQPVAGADVPPAPAVTPLAAQDGTPRSVALGAGAAIRVPPTSAAIGGAMAPRGLPFEAFKAQTAFHVRHNGDPRTTRLIGETVANVVDNMARAVASLGYNIYVSELPAYPITSSITAAFIENYDNLIKAHICPQEAGEITGQIVSSLASCIGVVLSATTKAKATLLESLNITSRAIDAINSTISEAYRVLIAAHVETSDLSKFIQKVASDVTNSFNTLFKDVMEQGDRPEEAVSIASGWTHLVNDQLYYTMHRPKAAPAVHPRDPDQATPSPREPAEAPAAIATKVLAEITADAPSPEQARCIAWAFTSENHGSDATAALAAGQQAAADISRLLAELDTLDHTSAQASAMYLMEIVTMTHTQGQELFCDDGKSALITYHDVIYPIIHAAVPAGSATAIIKQNQAAIKILGQLYIALLSTGFPCKNAITEVYNCFRRTPPAGRALPPEAAAIVSHFNVEVLTDVLAMSTTSEANLEIRTRAIQSAACAFFRDTYYATLDAGLSPDLALISANYAAPIFRTYCKRSRQQTASPYASAIQPATQLALKAANTFVSTYQAAPPATSPSAALACATFALEVFNQTLAAQYQGAQ